METTYEIKVNAHSVLILTNQNDEDGWPIIAWQRDRSKDAFREAILVKADLERRESARMKEENQ